MVYVLHACMPFSKMFLNFQWFVDIMIFHLFNAIVEMFSVSLLDGGVKQETRRQNLIREITQTGYPDKLDCTSNEGGYDRRKGRIPQSEIGSHAGRSRLVRGLTEALSVTDDGRP